MPLFDLGAPASADATSVRAARSLSCVSCGLFRGCRSPRMEPHGRNRRSLMVVGDAPGQAEDREGRPWVGKTGQLLRRTLGSLGVDLDRDAVSLNAIACRPSEDNRDPSQHEVACCRVRTVLPAVTRERPHVIMLLGGSATESVIGALAPDASSLDSIARWRGLAIPAPEWGAWLCPTFHPSFVARSDDRPEVATVWERDLRVAIGMLESPVPEPDDLRRRVVILRDDEDVLAALGRVRRGSLFSHDYETTGLRAQLHELVSASFAVSPDCAFAFAWTCSERVAEAWSNVLADDRVGKVAHNIKFEDEWGREKLGVEDIAWRWDSMLAAHVLDNRPGICGLKHQALLNFGMPNYDALISPYLESTDDKDPAAPNRIREFIQRFGWDEELIYNGIDSLVGLRLSLLQMEQMKGVGI